MKPKSLKNTLLLTVAILVVISGLIISQIVTRRYGVGLIEGSVARAENIAHSLSLYAADTILLNDRFGLQKLGQLWAGGPGSPFWINFRQTS